MSKKVFIGVGHGGSDPGAVKYIVEKEYTLKTAKALADCLKEYGIDCKLSRTADIDTYMDSKVKMCNDYKPDLVIDVHFNAGGGTGFEVFYSVVGGTSKKLAENINTEVKRIFDSRGIKTRTLDSGADYFAIIRETDAPAVLCEGAFVDTRSDADFVEKNYKELAKAYAEGIAKTLCINKKNPTTKTETKKTESSGDTKKLYRIRKSWGDVKSQKGAYKNLEGAKKVCPVGYTVYDWNGKSVYTKTDSTTLRVGDKIKVKSGAKDYNGGGLASFVYDTVYTVLEVDGNRVVIGIGTAVTAAVNKYNLIKL